MAMWIYFFVQDGRMRKSEAFRKNPKALKYDRLMTKMQIAKHIAFTFVGTVLMSFTCWMEYVGNPGQHIRPAVHDDDMATFSERYRHRVTISLWLIAVAIEQGGNFYCCAFDPVSALLSVELLCGSKFKG